MNPPDYDAASLPQGDTVDPKKSPSFHHNTVRELLRSPMPDPQSEMSTAERGLLHDCNIVIKLSNKTETEKFYGYLLIRDLKLFRATHSSFEQYCRLQLGIHRATAYHYARYAQLILELLAEGIAEDQHPSLKLAKECKLYPLGAKFWLEVLAASANARPTRKFVEERAKICRKKLDDEAGRASLSFTSPASPASPPPPPPKQQRLVNRFTLSPTIEWWLVGAMAILIIVLSFLTARNIYRSRSTYAFSTGTSFTDSENTRFEKFANGDHEEKNADQETKTGSILPPGSP